MVTGTDIGTGRGLRIILMTRMWENNEHFSVARLNNDETLEYYHTNGERAGNKTT